MYNNSFRQMDMVSGLSQVIVYQTQTINRINESLFFNDSPDIIVTGHPSTSNPNHLHIRRNRSLERYKLSS